MNEFDTRIEQRLARVDEILGALADRDVALAESIELLDLKIRAIADQNRAIAEALQVLGGYINTSIEFFQEHTNDPEAHHVENHEG